MTPAQWCYRYRTGIISREELVEELSAMTYCSQVGADFSEIVDALDTGIIDSSIFDEIIAGISSRDKERHGQHCPTVMEMKKLSSVR